MSIDISISLCAMKNVHNGFFLPTLNTRTDDIDSIRCHLLAIVHPLTHSLAHTVFAATAVDDIVVRRRSEKNEWNDFVFLAFHLCCFVIFGRSIATRTSCRMLEKLSAFRAPCPWFSYMRTKQTVESEQEKEKEKNRPVPYILTRTQLPHLVRAIALLCTCFLI